MKTVLAFAFLLAAARAACPNACSQHGECGDDDSCNCHAGFQGGDCSERVCLYNWAWVTTANGDLNFDGDRWDGTVYSPTIKVKNNAPAAQLVTQAAPGGTWESWPYYSKTEEGHFYMECSNRGLCNRETGDCECFAGYEGTRCNRMACPDNCNGRGRCLTSSQLSSTYVAWDRDMARSCVCDPGWSGPSCADRQCPFGNDVLTKKDESYEVQFIDIYSTCGGSGTTTGCPTIDTGTAATDMTAGLAGHARLQYTDHHGETWKTGPFAVQHMDSKDASDAVATAAKDALVALPNNVFPSTITVTARYCEAMMDETADPGAGATLAYAFRAPNDAVTTSRKSVFKGGKMYIQGKGDTNTALDDADTAALTAAATQIMVLDNPFCIRLEVHLKGLPGDVSDITADVTDVTFNGKTNAQLDGSNVGTATLDVLPITSTSGGTPGSFSYTQASTVTASAAGSSYVVSTGVITINGVTLQAAKTDTFTVGSKVDVSCTTSSVELKLGRFTVSAVAGSTITVTETLPESACSSGTDTVTVTQATEIIVVPVDLTAHFVTGTDFRLKLATSLTTHTFKSQIGATNALSLFLEDEDMTAPGSDIASAVGTLSIAGAGTRENVQCGDRGLCDTESGLCKCFPGYTGDACDTQKAISA